jgi:hypothetical protein
VSITVIQLVCKWKEWLLDKDVKKMKNKLVMMRLHQPFLLLALPRPVHGRICYCIACWQYYAKLRANSYGRVAGFGLKMFP